MAEGPERGLELWTSGSRRGELDGYHLLHAARADLLRRLGRSDEAAAAYRRARRAGGQPGRARASSSAGWPSSAPDAQRPVHQPERFPPRRAARNAQPTRWRCRASARRSACRRAAQCDLQRVRCWPRASLWRLRSLYSRRADPQPARRRSRAGLAAARVDDGAAACAARAGGASTRVRSRGATGSDGGGLGTPASMPEDLAEQRAPRLWASPSGSPGSPPSPVDSRAARRARTGSWPPLWFCA